MKERQQLNWKQMNRAKNLRILDLRKETAFKSMFLEGEREVECHLFNILNVAGTQTCT